jgi:RecG-like helicase
MIFLSYGYTISTLKEKLPGKRPIKTHLIKSSLENELLNKLEKNLQFGSKAFWVTDRYSILTSVWLITVTEH